MLVLQWWQKWFYLPIMPVRKMLMDLYASKFR